MTTITCTASALARVLKDVKSVVKPRQTMAILSHVKIDARDGELRITATDLDTQIERTMAAEIETAGAFTVEADRFTNVIGSFPDGAQLKLAQADGFVALTSGRSRFRFPTLDTGTFPMLPFEATSSIPGTAPLQRAIASVRHAASIDTKARAFICGVFVGTRDGVLEIVGTNGTAMALVRTDIAAEVADMTIPNEAVALLLGREGDFTLHVGDGKIRAEWPGTEITAKLIDGEYPNYRRIIPNGGAAVTIDADDISSALNRVAMLSNDEGRSVRLTIERDKMTIANRTAGTGEGADEIPCDYAGEPLVVTIRSAIVREAMTAMNADSVTMSILSPLEPIRVTSPARPEMTIVLMPMSS